MRTFIRFSFIFLALAVFVTSCTMEKRVYRPGFHVDWNKKENTEKPVMAQQQVNPLDQPSGYVPETESENAIVAEISDESPVANVENKPVTVVKKVDKNVISFSASNNVKRESRSFLNIGSKAGLLAPFAEKSGGDNQIVALILCLLLGGFGVHSFYLGNTKKGIWQLVMLLVGMLTTIIFIGFLILAALGIWVLIDLIRIIVGDLGPGW